jgi:hypothetical protein
MDSTATLIQKIVGRQPGICLYGIAPPKLTTKPEQLRVIAAQQVERLSRLELDGLIVYDIQDEAERTTEPRPFPFLPTQPPALYAQQHLALLELPKVVYRCVQRDTPESFTEWLESAAEPLLSVLVGSPSRNASGGLSLREAYRLARQSQLVLGGVAIAERHVQRLDEHERMLAKAAAGCRFFITQTVYDVTSTLSLLSDYALATEAAGLEPLPIVLSFSPCGSLKSLAFLQWLGIAFPRWLENELRYTRDPLTTSLTVCERIFVEVWSYARSKRIPLGVNVESVSIKKDEIEASLELSRTLSGLVERELAREAAAEASARKAGS